MNEKKKRGGVFDLFYLYYFDIVFLIIPLVAQFAVGWDHFSHKKYDLAEQYLLRAYELDPNFGDTTGTLGLLYSRRDNDYEKALPYFVSAVNHGKEQHRKYSSFE